MDSSTTANDEYEPSASAEDPLMRQTLVAGDKMYISSVGWECPRCKSINNPLLQQCFCKPSQGLTISGPINSFNIDWNGLWGPWKEAMEQ